MQGLHSKFKNKVMLAQYRARNCDIWMEEQKQQNARDYAISNNLWKNEHSEMDEYLFELQFATLSQFQNNQLDYKIQHDMEQQREFDNTNCELLLPNVNTTHNQLMLEIEDTHTPKKCQVIGKNIQQWKPEFQETLSNNTQASHTNANNIEYEKLKRQIQEQEELFKDTHREIYQVYSKYLEDPLNPNVTPPSIVLLHGAAGTGKSLLLKNIIDYGRLNNSKTLQTAFNAINAVAIDGPTTASLIFLNANNKSCHECFRELSLENLKNIRD